MQSADRRLNKVGPFGSHPSVAGMPGASGPLAPKSSAITRYASSFENGLLEV